MTDVKRALCILHSNTNKVKGHIRFTQKKNKPVKPFHQLLMVLPKQSKKLLPYKYQLLMTEMESDIIEYYPENYTINCNTQIGRGLFGKPLLGPRP